MKIGKLEVFSVDKIDIDVSFLRTFKLRAMQALQAMINLMARWDSVALYETIKSIWFFNF